MVDVIKPIKPKKIKVKKQDGDKDWDHECEVCGEKPTVYPTGLCGPCCFGEADNFLLDGNFILSCIVSQCWWELVN